MKYCSFIKRLTGMMLCVCMLTGGFVITKGAEYDIEDTIQAMSDGVAGKDWLDGIIYGSESFQAKVRGLKNEESIPQNSIYVSAAGSDNTGDGSIGKPYGTIQYALDNVNVGETILVRGGTYKERIIMKKSGTEGNYITIKNYPNETPIIDNTGASLSDGTQVDFNGQSYIHFEGFEVCNNKTTWAYAIYMGNSESNIIVRNNIIHDVKANKPGSSSSSGANAIIMYGENIKPISNILVAGNLVYDNDTGWCEAISTASNCEYINVIGNTILNNTNIGIDFCGNFGYCSDPSLDQPRYCVGRGNIVSNCNCPYATSYGLYVDGARDCIFENNISFNNQGGIEIGSEEKKPNTPVKNITIRNNLVYGNTVNGITVGGYETNVGTVYNTRIYNNTIVDNGNEGNGEIHIAMIDGVDIRNNIIYRSKADSLVVSEFGSAYTKNLTFGNNLYYANTTEDDAYFEMFGKAVEGFNAWKAYDATGKYADPVFVDKVNGNYRISGNSPAVNMGDNSVEQISYDLDGNDRMRDAIDAGCYEVQSGEVVTVTTTVSESTTETTTNNTTENTTSDVNTETTTVHTQEGCAAMGIYLVNSDNVTSKNCTVNNVEYNLRDLGSDGAKLRSVNYIKFTVDRNCTLAISYSGKKVAVLDSSDAALTADSDDGGVYTVTLNKGGTYKITGSASGSNTQVTEFVLTAASSGLMGDVNGDGTVDIYDATKIAKFVIGSDTLTESGRAVADVNNDGVVDIYDATKIAKVVIGSENM